MGLFSIILPKAKRFLRLAEPLDEARIAVLAQLLHILQTQSLDEQKMAMDGSMASFWLKKRKDTVLPFVVVLSPQAHAK